MSLIEHWRWRRKRNQSHGYWENITSGERVGPIPLDESGRPKFIPAADHQGAVAEAVAIMQDARGHYGIEECSGPGQPATEWDEIAARMRAFVHRYRGQ